MSHERVLHGFIQFWSETETEGGYWAFFHKRRALTKIPQGHCQTCGLFVQNITTEKLKPCSNGQPHCEETSLAILDHAWIHVLKNGDQLTIYDKDGTKIVWEGTIELIPYPIFSQQAYDQWIHADQTGIERETW